MPLQSTHAEPKPSRFRRLTGRAAVPKSMQTLKESLNSKETDIPVINLKTFRCGRHIATGGFGTVYECKVNQQTMAAKQIKIFSLPEDERRLLVDEIQVCSQLRHPGILEFYGTGFSPCGTKVILFTELMSNTLEQEISKSDCGLEVERVFKFAIQVASALQYMHSQEPPIIHRDIKPGNIMLPYANGQPAQQCKLADFGLARQLEPSGLMTHETGSYRWMAPEVTMHRPYNHTCDIYSLGLLVWAMSTGIVPFGAGNKPVQVALDVATKRLSLSPPDGCNEALMRTMTGCWSWEWESRISLAKVLSLLGVQDPPPTPPRLPKSLTTTTGELPQATNSDPDPKSYRKPYEDSFEDMSGTSFSDGQC